MKITVLMGSPYTDGNNDKLVKAFTKGAKEAGHAVSYTHLTLPTMEAV